MMHHFDSRNAIIKASITHLVEQLLTELSALLTRVREETATSHAFEESLGRALDALWDFFHLPSHSVLRELQIATRTDPVLAGMLLPAEETLETGVASTLHASLPLLRRGEALTETLTDLVLFTLQGVVFTRNDNREDPRIRNLLHYLLRQSAAAFEPQESAHEDWV